MIMSINSRVVVFCLLSIAFIGRADALEILHFIEAKDHARVVEDASGLKIADDGVVYVTSTEKGTLLKITDGKIEANSLSPSPFKDQDLGGVDVLANGQLVIVTEDDGQVGILDPDLKLKNLFSPLPHTTMAAFILEAKKTAIIKLKLMMAVNIG